MPLFRKAVTAAAVFAVMMFAVMMLALAGCGADSPEEVVRQHLEMLDQRQFDEFYDMHAQGALPSRQEYINSLQDSFPEGAEITDIKVTMISEEADTATVNVEYVLTLPGAGERKEETTVKLVMENGVWKISEGL